MLFGARRDNFISTFQTLQGSRLRLPAGQWLEAEEAGQARGRRGKVRSGTSNITALIIPAYSINTSSTCSNNNNNSTR